MRSIIRSFIGEAKLACADSVETSDINHSVCSLMAQPAISEKSEMSELNFKSQDIKSLRE